MVAGLTASFLAFFAAIGDSAGSIIIPPLEHIAATALALAFLVGTVALILIKREITRGLAIIDRVPEKEWFDGVTETLKQLPPEKWFEDVSSSIQKIPDPIRLAEHYKLGHDHGNLLTIHELRIKSLEDKQRELMAVVIRKGRSPVEGGAD